MIRLEKFDKSCFEQLIAWVDDPAALMQFAGADFNFPLTIEQLEYSFLETNRFPFKVVHTGTGAYIGHAEVYLPGDRAFLGRILIADKALRGKGLGKEIVDQLLNYAFTDLGQEKVTLNVFDWNISAIKCYEKAGFSIVPGKNTTRSVNGETWNAVRMNIDKEKWMISCQ